METVKDEAEFLRDLVKASRQRTQQVKWVDRDGTQRLTVLTQPEFARIGEIARRERIAAAEVLRRAAHIPVAKQTPRGETPA